MYKQHTCISVYMFNLLMWFIFKLSANHNTSDWFLGFLITKRIIERFYVWICCNLLLGNSRNVREWSYPYLRVVLCHILTLIQHTCPLFTASLQVRWLDYWPRCVWYLPLLTAVTKSWWRFHLLGMISLTTMHLFYFEEHA